MDQIETLKQTLIEKNTELAGLKKLLMAGVDITVRKSVREKSLWAMLFVVCDKYVRCPKCDGKTKPAGLKTGVVLACCKTCGHLFKEAASKYTTLNAYWNNFKREAR